MNTQEAQREDIARLAYQLWEERGCPVGSPEVDWERAEKSLQYDASSDLGATDAQTGEADTAAAQEPNRKLDSAAPKTGKRPPRASGRTNEGPRRSTQVR